MKILDVREPAVPGVLVVRYARHRDERGYFCETMRRSVLSAAGLPVGDGGAFVQCNESFSRAGVLRGLHFQWDPPMGKLVRTVSGRMIDLVLDLRRGSPWYGKVAGYDLPARPGAEYGEWIWVPPGLAHGNLFPEDSTIEYFCTAEYNPRCEAGVGPLAADLDWSSCGAEARSVFEDVVARGPVMSAKDRSAPGLAEWSADPRSRGGVFG